MKEAFPLILLVICLLFVAVVVIHNFVIRPLRRYKMNKAADKRMAELKLGLW